MTDRAVAALCRTYRAYLALGGDTIDGPGCLAVRQDATPLVHDVNHLQLGADAEPGPAFDFLETSFGDRPYRRVMTDPFTSPRLLARLSLEDYQPGRTLQGLLTGRLRGPAPESWEIRPVVGDTEWRKLDRLVRALHVEIDRKTGRSVYSEEVSAQIQQVRRRAAPRVQFFLAWDEGEAVAFFSSWPGVDGVGMVEDLFTLPSHRGRGIARALIHHCVEDARARGAKSVLIGSDPDDTPKHLYEAMGFEPVCVTWGWLRSGVS